MDPYLKHLRADAPDVRYVTVKDVAVKKGRGTESVGMWRYYVLIEGDSKKGKDGIILEWKQCRPSAP